MARSTDSKPTTRKPAARSRARKTAPKAEELAADATEVETGAEETGEVLSDASEEPLTGAADNDIIATAGEGDGEPAPVHDSEETRWVEGDAPEAEPVEEPATVPDPASDEAPSVEAEAPPDTGDRDTVVEEADPPTTVAPALPPQQVTVQKVGFLPLATGGAVAAVAGLAAGWVLFGQADAPDLSALETQGAQLEEFGARLDALPPAPDPAELRAAVQGDLDTIGAEIETLREELASLAEAQQGIDGRLAAVERAPNEDGTLADEALAAFDSDFEDLRSRIGELANRIDSATAETEAALAAREEQLAAVEEAARAEAEVAGFRAALVELRAALQGGEPFPDTLATLQASGEVPAPLPELAETGAPTLAGLRDDFPDAARAALAAARSAGEDGEAGSGLGSFFRSTFNVRSTAPQEGATVDAILSRAEAALADGDLATALTEVESLPAGAAAPLADWTATARTRLDALAAEDQLSQSLNQGD